jgi:predicted transposase YdaD
MDKKREWQKSVNFYCMRRMYSVYFTQKFFLFRKYRDTSATVTHLLIKLYNSMVYVVSPMCHYSKRRKALFCFLRTKMSKNSTIQRVTAW